MPQVITFPDEHRKKHFAFFSAMSNPHFGITADVDITEFLDHVRRSPTLRFTPGLVYLIGRTAMEVRPFRWRIRDGEIFEHDVLQPSFAVPTSESSAFSFCTVAWEPDPVSFHQRTEDKIEEMKTNPSFEDEEGQDNYLFLSAFPWASFTSVTHAMNINPADSVPRVCWGKYYKRDGKVFMPLGVQAHHGLVDGSDLGEFYQKMEQLLRNTKEIFQKFEKK